MTTESITDDHIDRTQWLPRGEAMVTPEREGKGDLIVFYDEDTGHIREARAVAKNILSLLLELKVIDDQQHHDAGTYQIWRDMHQASMGLRRPVSSGNQEAIGVRLRAYGYVLITQRLEHFHTKTIDHALETMKSTNDDFSEINRKRLEHFHTKTIDHVLETMKSTNDDFSEINHRQRYRQAFEALSMALPPIREQITYLEGLSEADRNEMSEERLKKLVEQIAKGI